MRLQNGSGRNAAMILGGLAAGIVGSKLLPPLIGVVAGSGRVRAGKDPFALLIDDHRQIASFLNQLLEPQAGKVQRSRLFLQLKRKLAKHALAEEDVVYPIVHEHSHEGDQSKHLYDEHAEMKILLYEIEHNLKSGEDCTAVARSLSDLVRRHVDDEENRIFPQLREQLTKSKLPKVSGAISREEALIV